MATAQVGYGRQTWNAGAWNTSPDALATISGEQINLLLNNVTATASTLNNISGRELSINLGQIIAGSSVFLTPDGIQSNISVGQVTTGEGREVTITTAGQLAVNLNAGLGWSRDEWSEGAWNQDLTGIVSGSGVVFIEDGQELTASLNNLASVTGSVDQIVSGELIQTNVANIDIEGGAPVTIVGEELVSATVNVFAVSAGGSITINTPTFEANVELTTGLVVGSASFFEVNGVEGNVITGTVIANSENFISLTGQELTSFSNTITTTTQNIIPISLNALVGYTGTVIANSDNFLTMTGQQVNTSVTSLKFWDPIKGNITETWTNIH